MGEEGRRKKENGNEAMEEGEKKKEEGRQKKEKGHEAKEEGEKKKEEGRHKKEEGDKKKEEAGHKKEYHYRVAMSAAAADAFQEPSPASTIDFATITPPAGMIQ